jgi:hypothetical protein
MSIFQTEPFRTFLFSYEHAGSSWVLEIKAQDADDARARLRKQHSATYDGEMVAKVAIPPVGWRGVAASLKRLILGR